MSKCKNIILTLVVILSLGLVLTACNTNNNDDGQNNTNDNNAEEPTNNDEGEEVTLTVGGGLWKDVLIEFVEAEFPNVTLEYSEIDLGWPLDRNKIQEYIAAGTVPDLINFGNPSDIPAFAEFELIMPLNDFLEKTDFDLNRLEPELVPTIQSYGQDDLIYMMPVDLATWVLAYNIDVFDQLGIDYPVDNMSWDEVIDLARDLTVEEGGIQYRGLHPGPHHQLIQQTGFTYIDPETNEPLYEGSEEIRQVIEIYQDIIGITGNFPEEDAYDYFLDLGHLFGGRLAMQPQWNSVTYQISKEEETGLNWDQVTWPVLGGDYEATGPNAEGQMVGISPHSDHIELAEDILTYLLSDEFQSDYARNQGKAPVLIDEKVVAEIANNELILDSPKNVEALTLLPYKKNVQKRSPYQGYVEEAFLEGMEKIIEEDIDINSALRFMQETAEIELQNAMKNE